MANLTTPEAILLSSSLFEARLSRAAGPDDKPKYYIRLGFTAEAMLTPAWKAIEAAVHAEAIAKWGAKAKAMIEEGSVAMPWKRDITAKGYDPAMIKCYVGGNTAFKPDVCGTTIVPATGKLVRITDPRIIYPGCIVKSSMAVRCFGGPGTSYKPGASLDLRNVLFVRDGERLSTGASSGDSDFAGDARPTPPPPTQDELDAMFRG